MNNKRKRLIFIMIIISVFGFMYILNSKTMLVSDDFPYHFVFEREPNENTKLITNPLEIFGSMATHWKIWGGRVSVHALLQFTFMIGTNFFNIVNSIMFVLLGFLIYKHINNTKEIKLSWLVTIYAVIFMFVPQPASTIMWKSGSANYLWSSVLILCMTLIFKNHYDKENIKDNILNMILLFPFGLIIGCSNENTGCALIIVEILFLIAYKIKYKRIPKWAKTALIGTILGYIFLVTSPGNYKRTDIMYPNISYNIENLFDYILKITRLTYTYLKEIIIALVISSVLLYKEKDNIKIIIKNHCIQFIFFILAFISIYSLVISPAYPERCWMFSFVYLTIVIGINLTKIKLKNNYVEKIVIILMILISLGSISEYSKAYYYIGETYDEINKQIKEIEKQKAAGKKDIRVHGIAQPEGRYNAFESNGYLNADPDNWVNVWIAKYYDVDTIKAID